MIYIPEGCTLTLSGPRYVHGFEAPHPQVQAQPQPYPVPHQHPYSVPQQHPYPVPQQHPYPVPQPIYPYPVPPLPHPYPVPEPAQAPLDYLWPALDPDKDPHVIAMRGYIEARQKAWQDAEEWREPEAKSVDVRDASTDNGPNEPSPEN